jgi:hypothetical protein
MQEEKKIKGMDGATPRAEDSAPEWGTCYYCKVPQMEAPIAAVIHDGGASPVCPRCWALSMALPSAPEAQPKGQEKGFT